MMDAQRFDDVAAGARELRATVERGDIALRVARGAAWSLEYTSTKDAQPEVERDGDTLRVKQVTGASTRGERRPTWSGWSCARARAASRPRGRAAARAWSAGTAR